MRAEPGLGRIFILLSGEHRTLPYSEVFALLDSEGLAYREVMRAEQALVIDAGDRATRLLGERSAYAMEGGRLLTRAEADFDSLSKACSGVDWSFLGGRSFGVRIGRVKRHWSGADTQKLQCVVGDSVTAETDCSVDLGSPDFWIRGTITDAGVFVFILDFWTDRKAFNKRRPKTRPYFHPGVLDPKISRAFVNLSAVKGGDVFVDPFCGTGGFLIEAAMMGMEAVGVDMDRRMIAGARKNILHYGLDCGLALGDAREMPVVMADGISTDPPYGRGTSTGGESAGEVLSGFLRSACDVLKEGGRLCTAAPLELNPSRLAERAGLLLLEEHRMRVHKSLTRSIIVAKSV